MKKNLALLAALSTLTLNAPAQELVSADAESAARHITAARLKGHTRFLASDLLEGRGPATRGDDLAQAYIAAQFESLGLEPGAPDGTYIQKVGIIGMKSTPPATLDFKKGASTASLQKQDFVAFSGVEQSAAGFENAELVFACQHLTDRSVLDRTWIDGNLKPDFVEVAQFRRNLRTRF